MNYNQVVTCLINGEIVHAPDYKENVVGVKNEIVPHCFSPDALVARNLRWAKDLYKIYEAMKHDGLVNDFIVHGSFGDFTNTNFSDIELTVYLREFYDNPAITKKIKKNITLLNKTIVKIDPLQHHGVFFIWDDFLCSYDESVLPLCAYNNCWSFGGEKIPVKVLFDVDSVSSKSLENYKKTLRSLSDFERSFFKYGYSLYAVKRFISNLFMVPVYYFQSKGLDLSKAEAMRKVWDHPFPEEFFMALRLATALREKWPESPRLLSCLRRSIVNTKIPQGRFDNILCSVFSDTEVSQLAKNELAPLVKSATVSIQRAF